ncbi:MAG: hypothetical protein J7480_07645, partial [Microbacteriaceae bacterium]|nr:hypothetical protein [Microbacteriaceae bacterium]
GATGVSATDGVTLVGFAEAEAAVRPERAARVTGAAGELFSAGSVGSVDSFGRGVAFMRPR